MILDRLVKKLNCPAKSGMGGRSALCTKCELSSHDQDSQQKKV